jgi:hypothetical protein
MTGTTMGEKTGTTTRESRRGSQEKVAPYLLAGVSLWNSSAGRASWSTPRRRRRRSVSTV